jgi:hypothetical protein
MDMLTQDECRRLLDKITGYVGRYGGLFERWYVGIATDPRHRLFEEHGVSEESEPWIFLKTSSEEVGHQVMEALLHRGMLGGRGWADGDGSFVYAYRGAPEAA